MPILRRYFDKKGEVNELRTLLRSVANERDNNKKREAIKKVIAYMTLGIDVSRLFSDMVRAPGRGAEVKNAAVAATVLCSTISALRL